METNISSQASLADFFRLIGQPARIQILLLIGEQEACVCHLEAVLGMRQASISQHLMILRSAGLVSTARDGRNIFYRLARPEALEIIRQAATLTAIPSESLQRFRQNPVPGCPCPRCNPGLDPDLTCTKLKGK